MKRGQKICISPSVALTELRLEELVGRYATVIEVIEHPNGTTKGCWVLLDGSLYEGEQEWYIPYISIIE